MMTPRTTHCQALPLSPNPVIQRTVTIALAALVLLTATACQHRFPSEQIPKTKWLILPFSQPATMSQNTLAVRGWWLGATTVRQNERAGEVMAETLSRQMIHLDFMNLYSAIDLKYYFANKARRLKDHFKTVGRDLTDEETAKLMAEVPQIEFAKDLGADKLLTGKIIRQSMSENRTFPWWWSVLEVEVQVTDVATGKIEWSRHYAIRRSLDSMTALQEEFGSRLIQDLKREYFLPQIRK